MPPETFLDNGVKLHIGDIVVGKNGQKLAKLSDAKTGEDIQLSLGTEEEPLFCQFGSSSFDENSNRQSLDVQCTSELECMGSHIDTAVLALVNQRKKTFSPSLLKMLVQPTSPC